MTCPPDAAASGGSPAGEFRCSFEPPVNYPVVVDLDGTLLRSDILWESIASLIRSRPWYLLVLPLWLLKGRSFLKRQLASLCRLRVEHLPFNQQLLTWLAARRRAGNQVILATGSDESVAKRVSDFLGLFDAVHASRAGLNLAGRTKYEFLQKAIHHPFAYVGNAKEDLAIWREAGWVGVVNPSFGVRRAIKAGRLRPHLLLIDRPPLLKNLAGAIRVGQWSKNLLLFVPLVLGHKLWDLSRLSSVLLAFLAFSLTASALYLLNDLADLYSDRLHPAKRTRPMAAGHVPIWMPLFMVPALAVAGVAIAVQVGGPFLYWLVLYSALAVSYVLLLRGSLLVDVIGLALLYTVRLWAGGAAGRVQVSAWLAAFGFFMFTSLAFLKRYSELLLLGKCNAEVSGRAYDGQDLEMLRSFGVASGFLACLVSALYINSDAVTGLYARPVVLWLLVPTFVYWVSRVWLLAGRGLVGQDPVAFALTDKTTLALGVWVFVVLLAAGMR